MSLVARCVFKLSAPLHAHDYISTLFDNPPLSEGEISDFIDPKSAKVFYQMSGLDITLTLLYGAIENPLVPGNTLTGFHSFELLLVDKHIDEFHGKIPSTIKEHFRETMFICANKLISFMKYEKGHPFLREAQIGDITSWVWEDGDGKYIGDEPKGLVLAHFPGYRGSLNSEALRKSDLPRLEQYFHQHRESSVIDELLSQAKEAIFEERILLAVLLLAVSVEVRVKTAFLGQNSAASDAFDYSQEKGKVAISPVEFIDKIAERTFKESFAKVNRADFENIEQLFQCRNKVAHRGIGKYRDRQGNEKLVDLGTLHNWWRSVRVLFEWITQKTSAPE